MVVLRAFCFPTDTAAHPHLPPGWRWQVMVGDVPPEHLDRCANAGFHPGRTQAALEGDQNAATATKAMQMAGLAAHYLGVTYLEHDPIPAGVDRLNTV